MAPTPPAPRTTRAFTLVPLLLALIGHAGVIGVPFVYDDVATVVENPSLVDLHNWRWILLFERFRPLVNLSHAVERALFGLDPRGPHAINLALHVLTVGILELLLLAAARRARHPAPELLAATAAALFAVHPLLTSTVSYVSARADLLAAPLSLLALAALLNGIDRGRGAAVVLGVTSGTLALAAKETALVLPAALLALDALLSLPGLRLRLARAYLPVATLAAVAATLRVLAFAGQETRIPSIMRVRYPLSQPQAVLRYLGLLIWPHGLSIVHDLPWVISARSLAFLGPLAALLALLLLALWLRRREPLASLGIVWFLLFLAPTSSFVPLVEPMAEHRAYLPAAGILLAIAAIATRAMAALRSPRGRTAAVAGLGLVVALLAAMTAARIAVWRDQVRLWREAARGAPGAYAPHLWLAEALRARGECEEALTEYLEAVRLLPPEPRSYPGLLHCATRAPTRADAVRAAMRVAIANAPTSIGARVVLGRLGRDDAEARRALLQASELCGAPDGARDPSCHELPAPGP